MQPATGTTELVLPGLEGAVPVSEPQPGHWIERGPQKRLMVFAGRSHPELAGRITEQLGIELGAVDARDVRERRDVLPLRRVDPRRRRVHHPDRLPARSTST